MKKPAFFKPAKSRDWTDAEVSKAAEFIQSERPDVWQELMTLESTTGDLRGSWAADVQGGLLKRLHPGCEFSEITQLGSKLRKLRRTIIFNRGN